MELMGKKVTVVGLAKSGLAVCNLLLQKGAKPSITESQDNQKLRNNLKQLEQRITAFELGRHTQELITGQDLVVVSPGIPENALPIAWARARGIAVIGEIELAYRFCPAPVIAITGTNGKTTVTTLVGRILQAAGKKCVVCGNIGNPFSAELGQITKEHIVVLEVSSFQLETIDKFKPKVAAILNLTVDHLDRYASFEQYLAAKLRIFLNQDSSDFAVLGGDQPDKAMFATRTKAKVEYFSQDRYKNELFRFNNNYAAAILISSLFSVPEVIAKQVCSDFKGIEHRLEEVAQIGGIKFINDSKATNIDSTFWALNTIERPVVLIAGGRDKGGDYGIISDTIKQKVRALVLLGEASQKIEAAFGGLVLTKAVKSLPQAVQTAWELAQSGDCVLLSPMCSSYDMFSDYTHRGRVFTATVQELAQTHRLAAHSL